MNEAIEYHQEKAMARGRCKHMHHSYHGYCGPGFIYIATDGELHKIGCTKEKGSHHNVYKSAGILAGVVGRIAGLNRVQSERVFRLAHVIYTPICVKGLEKHLHDIFAEQRASSREWFLLTHSDLDFLFGINSFDGHELTHIGITE